MLVHGGVLGGRHAWVDQRPLTRRWTLVAPDLPGHGDAPDGPNDFEVSAELVVRELLQEPAHLVGFSYGGIVAMLAAAARPGSVRSLTTIEPPATSAAPDVTDVTLLDRSLRDVLAAADEDPRTVLGRFYALVGVNLPVPDPLPEPLAKGARTLAHTRPPGEATLPLSQLAGAPFQSLVLSGGHSRAFEAIADAIADAIGAERDVVPGAGHLVPTVGRRFNDRLETFLLASTT
ncbi:MAG: alpha/beta fold hydrolase [Pseudonocardiaceae bacterium]